MYLPLRTIFLVSPWSGLAHFCSSRFCCPSGGSSLCPRKYSARSGQDFRHKELRNCLLLIALAVFNLTVVQNICAYAQNEELTVVVVLGLTGPLAAQGDSIQKSIVIAQEKFDPDKRVKFVFEDDGFQPKNTVSIVSKYIARGGKLAFIIWGSGNALAAAPIVEQAKVPMVAMGIARSIVSGRTYVMKHWVTAETENKVLVNQVLKEGYKKMAVVATTQEAMLSLRNLFIKSVPELIVSSNEVAQGDTDFKSLALRMMQHKPDSVYLLLLPPQSGLFARQLRILGYKGVIFGAHQFEDSNEIKGAAGALEGSWFVSGNLVSGSDFERDFISRYGVTPNNGAGNGYDLAKMMIEGSTKGNLNVYLHNLHGFSGSLGIYDATSDNDFSLNAAIKRIRENRVEPAPSVF